MPNELTQAGVCACNESSTGANLTRWPAESGSFLGKRPQTAYLAGGTEAGPTEHSGRSSEPTGLLDESECRADPGVACGVSVDPQPGVDPVDVVLHGLLSDLQAQPYPRVR